ncbi:hypothetical protein RM549_03010 [Salegentibacter sp. F188]|uniref:Uncharacterized protein n=1 Tax=Autumnicola patrickiae TaxID=3075591 RepID=A0ABU3DYH1_9FLAO|nr:hypothetical protein [Salegentibacter sp. F188]MDT0688735.1 hypothetical protein [Salegentibacter sp. F188]
MKDKLIEYLKYFFDLPGSFFTMEADLYTLAILSLFFKKTDPEVSSIRKSDINIFRLYFTREELRMDLSGREIKIWLQPLLHKHLSPEIRKNAVYIDHIGNDSFSGYLLEVVLFLMDMPKELNFNESLLPQDDNILRIKDLVAATQCRTS